MSKRALFVNQDSDPEIARMMRKEHPEHPVPRPAVRYNRRRQDLFENLIIGGLLALIIGAAVVAVLVAPVWWFNAAACSAKWSSVGTTSWGPLQDCIVTLPDGTRRPAVMLRSVDP